MCVGFCLKFWLSLNYSLPDEIRGSCICTLEYQLVVLIFLNAVNTCCLNKAG